MTEPTPDRIEAAIAAIQAESDIWNELCTRLNRCSSQVLGLTIDADLPAGALFSFFLTTYNGMVGTFAARCREGSEQTFAMAGALYTVARSYDAVEQANLRPPGLAPGRPA